MKRINNKGFAISTIIYGTLIMAVMIVMILLSTMAFSNKSSKDMAKGIETDLNREMGEDTPTDPTPSTPINLPITITTSDIQELQKPSVTVSVPKEYDDTLAIYLDKTYDAILNHSVSECKYSNTSVSSTTINGNNRIYTLEVPHTYLGAGTYKFRVTSKKVEDKYNATTANSPLTISQTTTQYYFRVVDDEDDFEGVYQFSSGWTWNTFINSSNNPNYGSSTTTKHFTVSGSNVYSNMDDSPVYSNSTHTTFVTAASTITSGTYYVIDNCCFKGDTRIMISLDGKTKAIKDIDIGDEVVIQNTKTGERKLTTALKVANEHKPTTKLATVNFENGSQLQYNPYHPIWTTKGYKTLDRYKNYKRLEVGDVVILNDGRKSKVKTIRLEEVPKDNNLVTYNILLSGVNDYYLEDEWGYYANNILVHHGILKYYDEDDYRKKHANDCINKKLYKDFNFDKASDEEIINFMIKLYQKNKEAYNEYFKYYINAKQYQRFVKLYSKIKSGIANKNSFNSIQLDKFTGLNSK